MILYHFVHFKIVPNLSGFENEINVNRKAKPAKWIRRYRFRMWPYEMTNTRINLKISKMTHRWFYILFQIILPHISLIKRNVRFLAAVGSLKKMSLTQNDDGWHVVIMISLRVNIVPRTYALVVFLSYSATLSGWIKKRKK